MTTCMMPSARVGSSFCQYPLMNLKQGPYDADESRDEGGWDTLDSGAGVEVHGVEVHLALPQARQGLLPTMHGSRDWEGGDQISQGGCALRDGGSTA